MRCSPSESPRSALRCSPAGCRQRTCSNPTERAGRGHGIARLSSASRIGTRLADSFGRQVRSRALGGQWRPRVLGEDSASWPAGACSRTNELLPDRASGKSTPSIIMRTTSSQDVEVSPGMSRVPSWNCTSIRRAPACSWTDIGRRPAIPLSTSGFRSTRRCIFHTGLAMWSSRSNRCTTPTSVSASAAFSADITVH